MDTSVYSKATELLKKSEPIRRDLQDLEKLATMLHRKGRLCELKGDLEGARESLLESLGLQQSHGEHRGLAATYQLLGIIAHKQGNRIQAENYLISSLDIWEDRLGQTEDGEVLHQNRGRARTLAQLGVVYAAMGRGEEAQDFSERARDAFLNLGDLGGLAGSEAQLGNLAFAATKYEQAYQHYIEAQTLFTRIQDRAGMAGVLYQLGLTAIQTDTDTATAQAYFREGVILAEQLENLPGRAMCLYQLGHLSYQVGDLDDAWQQFNAALTLWNSIGESSRQQELAGILHKLGQFAEQGRHYDLAERIYCNLESYDALNMPQDSAAALHHLGFVKQSQGNIEQAESYFNRSLAIKRDLGDCEGTARTLYALAWLIYQQGDRDRAVDHMTESLSLFEQSESDQVIKARKVLQQMRDQPATDMR